MTVRRQDEIGYIDKNTMQFIRDDALTIGLLKLKLDSARVEIELLQDRIQRARAIFRKGERLGLLVQAVEGAAAIFEELDG